MVNRKIVHRVNITLTLVRREVLLQSRIRTQRPESAHQISIDINTNWQQWIDILHFSTSSPNKYLSNKTGAKMTDELARYLVFSLIVLIGISVLMAPLLRYIFIGWWAKRKDIMDGLNADARRAYFEMFSRDGRAGLPEDPIAAMEQFHFKWYGRRHFAWPGILLFSVGIFSIGLVTLAGLSRLGYPAFKLFILPNTAMAAIAGAYLWVVDDHITRSRRLDFSPSDVHWGTLRLVIAIPMGYCFGVLLTPSLAPFVAFSLGAFPLTAIIKTTRRIANKKLDLDDTTDPDNDGIIKLQGINKNILERLQNEDIGTILQIAYCDPIRLVMRANLNFNFVTDCMNQALAWLYLEEKLIALRPYGLRGAVEIKTFIDELDFDPSTNNDPALARAHVLSQSALPLAAEAIQISPSALQIALRQIAEDPFTDFLCRIWS